MKLSPLAVERCTAIAEWLEAGAPERNGVAGFDMAVYARAKDCGTVCCIGGTALYWYDGRINFDNPFSISNAAAAILDIANLNYCVLFNPRLSVRYVCNLDLTDIDAGWAARCLRHFIATGEVDWIGTRQ